MLMYHKVILTLFSFLLITSIHAEEVKTLENSEDGFSDFSSIINSFIDTKNRLKEKTNIAGKQRMLTQRMTKLALLIELDIKRKKNIKKLDKSAKLYAENLVTLESTNQKITQQLKLIRELWKPFYKNIENIIHKKKGLDYIINHNKELLKASNKLVTLYETSNSTLNYLDKEKLYIVDLAGRQRMLLEKMSKEKILLFKKDAKYRSEVKKSINEFELALKVLRDGDNTKHIPTVSNPKLIKKLNLLESIWKELKPLYQKRDLNKKELSRLIRQSSLLLLESNIYVKLTELEREY